MVRAFLQWSCSFSSLPKSLLVLFLSSAQHLFKRQQICSYGHPIIAGVQRHHLLHICSVFVRDEPMSIYPAQEGASLTTCFHIEPSVCLYAGAGGIKARATSSRAMGHKRASQDQCRRKDNTCSILFHTPHQSHKSNQLCRHTTRSELYRLG